MDFNDADSIFKFVEKEVLKALEYTAREMQRGIRVLILKEIYSVYTPEKYQRTHEMLDSIEVAPVKKEGNEYIIEVRVKDVKHKNPSWYNDENAGIKKGDYVTLSQVMEAFADGNAKTGTYGTEIDIMDLANDEWMVQRKALRMIFDYIKGSFDITWQ